MVFFENGNILRCVHTDSDLQQPEVILKMICRMNAARRNQFYKTFMQLLHLYWSLKALVGIHWQIFHFLVTYSICRGVELTLEVTEILTCICLCVSWCLGNSALRSLIVWLRSQVPSWPSEGLSVSNKHSVSSAVCFLFTASWLCTGLSILMQSSLQKLAEASEKLLSGNLTLNRDALALNQ